MNFCNCIGCQERREENRKELYKMNSNWFHKNPTVGCRARFFHPRTMGVMHSGVVTKVHKNGMVTVKFNVSFNGKYSFVTTPDNIKD